MPNRLPQVGDRVRLTGSGWDYPHIEHYRVGQVVTIESVNSRLPQEGRIPRIPGVPHARAGDSYFVSFNPRDTWAGEYVDGEESTPLSLDQPETVFNLGMACLQGGVTSVADLQSALRLWTNRDRLTRAYENATQAQQWLRGVVDDGRF